VSAPIPRLAEVLGNVGGRDRLKKATLAEIVV